MGKKRIASKGEKNVDSGKRSDGKRLSRKHLEKGKLYVESTYNNTRVTLTDLDGNTVSWSSSGALGFKGAKKGTPFAAAKIGEVIGEQGLQLGMKDIDIVVKGVGAGRESAIRSFIAKTGATITTISDVTPIPFNGPRAPKPRRV